MKNIPIFSFSTIKIYIFFQDENYFVSYIEVYTEIPKNQEDFRKSVILEVVSGRQDKIIKIGICPAKSVYLANLTSSNILKRIDRAFFLVFE